MQRGRARLRETLQSVYRRSLLVSHRARDSSTRDQHGSSDHPVAAEYDRSDDHHDCAKQAQRVPRCQHQHDASEHITRATRPPGCFRVRIARFATDGRTFYRFSHDEHSFRTFTTRADTLEVYGGVRTWLRSITNSFGVGGGITSSTLLDSRTPFRPTSRTNALSTSAHYQKTRSLQSRSPRTAPSGRSRSCDGRPRSLIY